MEQLSLEAALEATRRARRDDLQTSKDAAGRSIAFSGEHYRRILDALRALGAAGGTLYEIAEESGIHHVAVARRMGELRRAGLVERPGDKRTTPTGARAAVWYIAAQEPRCAACQGRGHEEEECPHGD
ncbi:MAG: helix-turn-helix domain-containing protein [Planctomycetota bacterium]